MPLRKQDRREALSVMWEGIVIATLVVVFLGTWLWLKTPNTEYASRFRAGCSGWSPLMAVVDAGWKVALWYAYCTIAIVLAKLHPTPRKAVPSAGMTLALISLFIIGCGFQHLMDALTNFDPEYPASIYCGYTLSLLSFVSLWYIARGLVQAKRFTEEQRKAQREAWETRS